MRRRVAVGVLAMAVLLAMIPVAPAAAAETYAIGQITANNVWDSAPVVSGDRIAWVAPGGSDGGNDGEVFTWTPERGVVQVTQNDVGESGLRISGDRLVWESTGGSDSGADYEIFTWTPPVFVPTFPGGYFTGGIEQLTENSDADAAPDVSGDRVVWTGWGGSDGGIDNEIFTWTPVGGTTQVTLNAGTDESPRVSGDRIAWLGDLGSVKTWTPSGGTVEVWTDSLLQPDRVRISGDRLAWQARRLSDQRLSVFTWTPGGGLMGLSTGTTNDAGAELDGDRLVFLRSEPISGEQSLWTWTPSQGQTMLTQYSDGGVLLAGVSGDRAVLLIYSSLVSVRVENAADPTKSATLASGPAGSGTGGCSISGNRVVWANWKGTDNGNDTEIFTAVLNPQGGGVGVQAAVLQMPPVLSFSILAGDAPAGGGITPTSVDFGFLLSDAPRTGSHKLVVMTNAPSGYTVNASQNRPLAAGQNTIPDSRGDNDSITHMASGPWELNNTYGFGYTLANRNGTDAAFTSGFKHFANTESFELPQTIMSNSGAVPAAHETDITYKVNVGPGQAGGTYTNIITYAATGNF
jgi:hypothetical protein